MKLQDQTIFDRNIGSISAAQQERLHRSTVTVIGCGGLGCFVIEELARMGVGRLCISDPDRFSTSNINRQLYAELKSTGRFKVEVAVERLDQLHGRTTVVTTKKRFQESTQLLFENTEVVVDCLDTPSERLKLSEICNHYDIPLVHGAVERWYGQTAVQLAGGTVIENIYGARQHKVQHTLSVLSCTVALIASIQAAETCKLLLGINSPLHNNWMSIDLQRMTFDIIDLQH